MCCVSIFWGAMGANSPGFVLGVSWWQFISTRLCYQCVRPEQGNKHCKAVFLKNKKKEKYELLGKVSHYFKKVWS